MNLLEMEIVFYNNKLQMIGNVYLPVSGAMVLPTIPSAAIQMQLVLHGVLMGRPLKLYSAMVEVRSGHVAQAWIDNCKKAIVGG